MSQASKSCELDVRVTPRASKSKIEASPDLVKVWVTAAPTDGQANDAVCEALAKALQLAKSRVAIVKGHTSRQKRIRIEGLDSSEVLNRLGGERLF
jgi:uncharacterized protein